jgi:hypothetical protein
LNFSNVPFLAAGTLVYADFYYKDGANQYQLFARYPNSVINATVDYVNNSDSWTWSGSSTGVNNVLLPASITYTNNPTLNQSSTTLASGDWHPLPDIGIAPIHEFRVTLGTKPKDFVRWVITAPAEELTGP